MDRTNLTQISESLSTAQTVLVVIPQDISHDKVAAALSLFLSLQKLGKQASCLCVKPMTVEYSSLVGVDKVRTKLAGNTLVITFDIDESTQKVSYDISNNKLKIFVKPNEGFPPLDPKRVVYSNSGREADLVLVIGETPVVNFGKLYEDNRSLFDKVKSINLFDPIAASFSEVIAKLLSQLRLPVDADIASNLLSGIEKATKKYSLPKVGAGTFEAAAFCLRAGGRRLGEKIDLKPMTAEVSAQKPPEEKEIPSSDWLAPKIYKGNTMI